MNKKGQAIVTVLILGMTFFSTVSCDASDEQESIGVQAGKAVKDMRGSAAETYKAGTEQAAQATQKMQVVAQDAMKDFQEQTAKSMADFQKAFQSMMENLNREVQKFNETLNAPDKKKT